MISVVFVSCVCVKNNRKRRGGELRVELMRWVHLLEKLCWLYQPNEASNNAVMHWNKPLASQLWRCWLSSVNGTNGCSNKAENLPQNWSSKTSPACLSFCNFVNPSWLVISRCHWCVVLSSLTHWPHPPAQSANCLRLYFATLLSLPAASSVPGNNVILFWIYTNQVDMPPVKVQPLGNHPSTRTLFALGGSMM